MDRDKMISFLNELGVKTKKLKIKGGHYDRCIKFEIYGIKYKIVWFINQSTLEIGGGNRPACLPFKYMYYDRTYPLVNGNKSIGFSYIKNEAPKGFERQYPYEVFRIPLEI